MRGKSLTLFTTLLVALALYQVVQALPAPLDELDTRPRPGSHWMPHEPPRVHFGRGLPGKIIKTGVEAAVNGESPKPKDLIPTADDLNPVQEVPIEQPAKPAPAPPPPPPEEPKKPGKNNDSNKANDDEDKKDSEGDKNQIGANDWMQKVKMIASTFGIYIALVFIFSLFWLAYVKRQRDIKAEEKSAREEDREPRKDYTIVLRIVHVAGRIFEILVICPLEKLKALIFKPKGQPAEELSEKPKDHHGAGHQQPRKRNASHASQQTLK